MRIVSLIPGWITLILSVFVFSDVVGIVRAKVYKERAIRVEIGRRKLHVKAFLLICFALVFMFMSIQ